MSRFYVGQRVRIKWSIAWPELSRHIGTIEEAWVIPDDAPYGAGEKVWLVAPDMWGSSRAPEPKIINSYRATHFSPAEDQLEPITDSYDVTSWDTCVWKPEHLRVGA